MMDTQTPGGFPFLADVGESSVEQRHAVSPGHRKVVFKMLELFRELSGYLATVVEAAAAVIIAYGAVEAGIRVLNLLITRKNMQFSKEDIRLNLGQWLTLALEFELAADILRTAVAPSWNDIGQLAAIIVIRTTLNYFLQKELEKAEARRGEPAQ